MSIGSDDDTDLLRALRRDGCETPAIIITAVPDAPSLQVKAILTKPFEPQRLKQLLNEIDGET